MHVGPRVSLQTLTLICHHELDTSVIEVSISRATIYQYANCNFNRKFIGVLCLYISGSYAVFRGTPGVPVDCSLEVITHNALIHMICDDKPVFAIIGFRTQSGSDTICI